MDVAAVRAQAAAGPSMRPALRFAVGSWSQGVRKNERRLSMNLLAQNTSGLGAGAKVIAPTFWSLCPGEGSIRVTHDFGWRFGSAVQFLHRRRFDN